MKKLLAGLACAVLAACGGGGGGDSPSAPGVPTPPAPKLLTATNYLDGLAQGLVASNRMDDVAGMVDELFEGVVSINDVPGTYNCTGGGSIRFERSASGVRTLSPTNCRLGPYYTYESGSITIPNASTAQVNASVYLISGDFQFNNLTYRTRASVYPAEDLASQAISGAFALRQSSGTALRATGSLSITRLSRVDQYTNIDLLTTQRDAQGDVTMDGGSMAISSPRMAGIPLTLNVSSASGTISASDGSVVVVSEVPPDSIRLELRDSATAQSSINRVAKFADSDIVSAINRALN